MNIIFCMPSPDITKQKITLPRCSSSELVLLHEMTDTDTINVINAKIYVRLKLRNLDLMKSNANYSMTGYKLSMKWILLS